MFITDLFVEYLRIVKSQLFVNKTIGCRFVESTFYNAVGQVNSRTHRQDDDQNNVLAYGLLTGFIYKLFPLEVHHTDTEKSSQTDKYGVDEIEIEGSQKINQITGRQSVSCRTKRRH